MAESWYFDATGRLYFAYRARNWDAVPVRHLNSTELTAVSAVAMTADGSNIAVTQQPSYNPMHEGYIGWIDAANLTGLGFVSIKLTPTVAGSIPAGWAPPRIIDVQIDTETDDEVVLRT